MSKIFIFIEGVAMKNTSSLLLFIAVVRFIKDEVADSGFLICFEKKFSSCMFLLENIAICTKQRQILFI